MVVLECMMVKYLTKKPMHICQSEEAKIYPVKSQIGLPSLI